MRVPVYQRNYSWKTTQVEQLLEDINSINLTMKSNNTPVADQKHFLGLGVFIENKVGPHETELAIVDGQQRLTTITIICSVFRDYVKQYVSNKLGSFSHTDIQKYQNLMLAYEKFIFIKPEPLGNPIDKLVPSYIDSDDYQGLIKNTEDALKVKIENIVSLPVSKRTLYQRAYYKVHEFIEEQITSETQGFDDFLFNFYYKVSDGLTLIPFVTAEDDDAFNLFETLNDRGLSLSALDLIKNKVLQTAGFDNQETLDSFDKGWNDIFGQEGIVEPKNSNHFLRVFLMLDNGHVNNSQVYKKYKEKLDSIGASELFLHSGLEAAKAYRAILSPVLLFDDGTKHELISDSDLSELFILLGKTKVKQWIVLGLAIYLGFISREISKDDALSALQVILKTTIRFKILDKRFNLIEKKFPELANALYTNTVSIEFVIDELEKFLENHASSEEVSTRLDEYLFEENDLAYILLRQLFKAQLHLDTSIATDIKLSLEHVLPEKHGKWIQTERNDDMKYRIGNFLLINTTGNSRLSNKSFDDKVAFYNESNVKDIVTDESISYFNCDSDVQWVNEFIELRSENINASLRKII